MTAAIDGPYGDVLLLLGALVELGDYTAARSCVNNVRITRIWKDVAALSATYVIPVLAADVPIIAAAGNADSTVVLLCSVEVIQHAVIGGDVIELRGWLVVLRTPTLAAINADGSAAVISVNHALRIHGIDPQAVMVAMWSGQKRQ